MHGRIIGSGSDFSDVVQIATGAPQAAEQEEEGGDNDDENDDDDNEEDEEDEEDSDFDEAGDEPVTKPSTSRR